MLDPNCIYISNDFSDVRDAIANGVTVVALVDNADDYKYLNCVIMGVLLPPYESLSAEIDGDTQSAASIYYSFLLTKIDIFANLLYAMYKGKRILIFVPEDESMNFGFVSVLCAFFTNMFGINIGMPGKTKCAISDSDGYVAMRADAMFVYGLIQMQEYCQMMPLNMPPSDLACGKMMQCMTYRFNSMEQCMNYCTQYIAASKKQSNGVFSPVFRVTGL